MKLDEEKLEKLHQLKDQGFNYPNQFRRTHFVKEILVQFKERDNDFLEANKEQIRIAGRIVAKRIMGKTAFINLSDMTGKIQVYLRKDELGEEVFGACCRWDLGDIIGINGWVFKTKTGELTVRAEQVEILNKILLSLPEKYHGLADWEVRCRQRYLDLIVNEESRDVFIKRSKIIDIIRDFLKDRQFLEVETPMMHVIPGGASARPFITHHNTFDLPLYLRIAPELYLKRLIVGGFERVFELNRCFRNEGVSVRHNPEFTTVEFYQAYTDYRELMVLTEELFKCLAKEVVGGLIFESQGQIVNCEKPFERLTLKEAVKRYVLELKDVDIENKNILLRFAEEKKMIVDPSWKVGKIQAEIFENFVEKQLIGPVFITEYPIEVSPLARRNDQNPQITDRFELFVNGKELANGFSELNDPLDQAERFKKQAEALSQGDEEAMHYDADYIQALSYAMPPTAGEGIGIDRLCMLFCNISSIRNVILFPLLRPENSNAEKNS